ncbi:arsenate reductase (glutaredoxin) [Crateriforma conspicua]|uniref:arsenate reductase (glutaredoxin) n=1 Tax=Crateriforma conspicua TaxID=2527996 RepID=UPI001189D6D3|nr:arsenate reductase (glutaredoxin) [Crateriforma conspicua]QDV62380.1 Arsenate reductase [Crateriforma conspicua]
MTEIYHNPRCTKSREALKLLQSRGLDVRVIKYLEEPPSEKQLRQIVKLLGIRPEQLVRKGEKLFKELGLADQTQTDKQWIAILAEHPRLIERPIVVHDGKAAIGRPIEQVVEILDG